MSGGVSLECVSRGAKLNIILSGSSVVVPL